VIADKKRRYGSLRFRWRRLRWLVGGEGGVMTDPEGSLWTEYRNQRYHRRPHAIALVKSKRTGCRYGNPEQSQTRNKSRIGPITTEMNVTKPAYCRAYNGSHGAMQTSPVQCCQ